MCDESAKMADQTGSPEIPPINFGSAPGKDSGFGTSTKTFESGAQREALEHIVRFDLISPYALERLAMTYSEGAMKYDDHNWRKGMPFSALLNHLLHHINLYQQGSRDEDHLAHAAWGLFAMMEFEVTDPAQDDLYFSPTREEEELEALMDKAIVEAGEPRPDYSDHPEDCTCRLNVRSDVVSGGLGSPPTFPRHEYKLDQYPGSPRRG